MLNKVNLFIGVSIIIFLMLFIDLPFALYINSITSSNVRHIFSFITKLAEPTSLIVITAFIYSYQYFFKNKSKEVLKDKFFIQLQIMLYSSIFIQVLKYIFGRYRLKTFFENGNYGFDFMNSIGYSNSSFPSGHSSIIFTFVTIIILLFPIENKKLKILFYLFASVIAFSRVMVNAHYLSDIIIGSYLGYIFTLYVFNYRKEKLILSYKL